jgi:hypothetical protein
MVKATIISGLIILGVIFGCLLSFALLSGADTFWRPIGYFPFPVSKILAMKPYGAEFWVETIQNDTYKITYPCTQGQMCWQKSNDIPTDMTDGNYVDYKVQSGACENDNFVYPLFRKIDMCVTSITYNEANWTASLAVDDRHKLWMWNRPWVTPDESMGRILVLMSVGATIGAGVGIYLSEKEPKRSA